MFKSKNAMIGVAAAAVAAVMLVAGLSVTATTGAATDITGGPSGDLVIPPSNPVTNPPASPIEPPAEGGELNPIGDAGPTSGAPGALPDAGYGVEGDASGMGFTLLLIAAGLAFVGAGATVAAGRRS